MFKENTKNKLEIFLQILMISVLLSNFLGNKIINIILLLLIILVLFILKKQTKIIKKNKIFIILISLFSIFSLLSIIINFNYKSSINMFINGFMYIML